MSVQLTSEGAVRADHLAEWLNFKIVCQLNVLTDLCW